MSEHDPMSIAESVAGAVVAQPDLFGASAFSADEQSVLRVARFGEYTGRITTRDQARVATVVALRQQGASFREIERRTGMDPRLAHRVLEYAERAGLVPALKDVLTRKIGEVTELAADRLAEEIRSDEPDSQLIKSLAVAYGVGADKMRDASISVQGDLHVHQSVHLEGADPMRDYLRARAEALSTDSQAAPQGGKALTHNASSQQPAVLAAGQVQPIEVLAVPVPPDPALGADQVPPAPKGGGGGVAARDVGEE